VQAVNRDRSEVLDELLVLRCQDGEAEALETLARRWHPRLLQHTILSWYYLEVMSMREIAGALSIPEGTVK
jgi:hypothetical protein